MLVFSSQLPKMVLNHLLLEYSVPRRRLSTSVLNLDSGRIPDTGFLMPTLAATCSSAPNFPCPLSISPLPPNATPQATLHWDRTNLKEALFIVFYQILIELIIYLHTLFHCLFLFYNKYTEVRCDFYLILYNIVVYSKQICPPMTSLTNN